MKCIVGCFLLLSSCAALKIGDDEKPDDMDVIQINATMTDAEEDVEEQENEQLIQYAMDNGYCDKDADADRCKQKGKICCKAMTCQCIACAMSTTCAKVCRKNPRIAGCKKKPRPKPRPKKPKKGLVQVNASSTNTSVDMGTEPDVDAHVDAQVEEEENENPDAEEEEQMMSYALENKFCKKYPKHPKCKKKPPKACCKAYTCSCLACARGTTCAKLCQKNPKLPGCKPPPKPKPEPKPRK